MVSWQPPVPRESLGYKIVHPHSRFHLKSGRQSTVNPNSFNLYIKSNMNDKFLLLHMKVNFILKLPSNVRIYNYLEDLSKLKMLSETFIQVVTDTFLEKYRQHKNLIQFNRLCYFNFFVFFVRRLFSEKLYNLICWHPHVAQCYCLTNAAG